MYHKIKPICTIFIYSDFFLVSKLYKSALQIMSLILYRVKFTGNVDWYWRLLVVSVSIPS